MLRMIIFLLGAVASAQAIDFEESNEVQALFEREGLTGTFVLLDLETNRLTGHNLERAQKRFIPASTFKIPHTLIALESGTISSVDEVLPYGGGSQAITAWERDMSLRDAIVISNVPVYQGMARKIGLTTMQEQLGQLDYGNHRTGDLVDRFWLDGPLEISAIEQCRFLARLATSELDYRSQNQAAVREILKLSESDGTVLHGKTGWTTAPKPDIGWWVGWVEQEGRIYTFALNLDCRTREDVDRRVPLGRECLRVLGIYSED